MKNTTKHLLFWGFLLLSIFQSYSQSHFLPGYIVTNQLDTIQGLIDFRSEERMGDLCTFKQKGEKKKVYTPRDIAAYRFNNGQYYISSEYKGKELFLEVLVTGELNIFYYKENHFPHYFFRVGNGPITKLIYFEKKVYVNSQGKTGDGINYQVVTDTTPFPLNQPGEYVIKSQAFKQQFKDALWLDTYLEAKLNAITKPSHTSLIKFANAYNTKKGAQIPTLVYGNKPKESNIEIWYGSSSIPYQNLNPKVRHPSWGINLNLPLKTNNLFVGIGLQYTDTYDDSEFYYSHYNYTQPRSYKFYRLPLTFRYQYPGTYIKPYIATGVNLYLIKDDERVNPIGHIAPIYKLGAAIKIYKGIHLNLCVQGDIMKKSVNYNNSGKIIFDETKHIGLMIVY